MSVETFLPVLSYLHWAVDESVFFRPRTKYVTTSLLIRRPGGVEVSSIYAGNAPILEFRV